MRFFVAVWSACSIGCALPKVALGGSVSTGIARYTRHGEAAAQRSVRGALWIAMSYAPHPSREERPSREATERAPLAPEPVPCAIDIACAWQRAAAAYEASWDGAAQAPLDPEGEL